MTTAADDRADEQAFEALLAGRPVPEGTAGRYDGLTAFTEAVRGSADLPGRPNAALAELLATGLLIDQSSPSTRTARAAGDPPSRGRSRNRRRFAMILPVLIAKFVSAGAVAQACAGAGVAVVVVAGAGAAGALPTPVQETFSDLVGTEDPAEPTDDVTGTDGDVTTVVDGDLADPTEVPAAPIDDPDDGTDDDAEDGTGTDDLTAEEQARTDWLAGPALGQKVGDWVAIGKENGWATGQTISAGVHARNEARKTARAAEESPAVEEGSDDSSGDEASAGDGESDDSDDRAGKAKDKSKGKGRD